VPKRLSEWKVQADNMDAKAWVQFARRNGHRVIALQPRAIAGIGLIIVVAASAITAALGAFAMSRVPNSIEIAGYAGHLGEWELTGVLSRNDQSAMSDLAGPLKLKHVGFCSKDGPEEKAGAIQVRLSRLSSGAEVKLLIDGIECTHRGDLSNAYIGTMVCPGRKAVPLTLWIK
jgi:hypothetical protein